MEFFYAVRTRTLFVSRDISTGRPCERRDPYGEDSRFGAGAEAFFSFEARGYGSLRSQGRPAESLCETTIASTRGSIRSYAIPLPLAGRGRNSHGEFRVRGSRSGRSRRKRDPSTVMPGLDPGTRNANRISIKPARRRGIRQRQNSSVSVDEFCDREGTRFVTLRIS